jgi:cytochrome P450/deferrochelatase/peroxidase EfeB
VQDFVIPLGEVFDTLLSYVDPSIESPPPRSVRADPEGFLAFVKRWNRVPLSRVPELRFPESFDYPLYSAYPDKTVGDIEGPRRYLPPPALDRPPATVELDDIQGNILSGYRARSATHVFYEIVDPRLAREWLSQLHQPASNWPGITPATRWTSRARRPATMVQVGFTFAGLQRLLPERQGKAGLDLFPAAFREGALARAALNHDVGESCPKHWLFGALDSKGRQPIHLVVSVFAQPSDADLIATANHDLDLLAQVEALAWLKSSSGAEAHGLKEIWALKSEALPEGREHFGFHDGITRPRINGLCRAERADHQPAASPGEFVLNEKYINRFGGPSIGPREAEIADLLRNGSFAAMRLLEQDVEAFNVAIGSEAARLQVQPALLEAKLMGRWKDTGQPLSLHDQGPGPASGLKGNAFDYAPSWEHPDVPDDHHGDRCPVGAHIRRTNPRSARVAGQRHSRRVLRRGMPASWPDAHGGTRKGLLGLFFGASLEHQFEFIQQQWIHGDIAASGIRGEQDPIAGQRSQSATFAIPGVGSVTLPPLVRTRGSLYLFYPGLSMLRDLAPERALQVQGEASPAGPDGAAVTDAGREAELDVLLRSVDRWLPEVASFVRAAFDGGLPSGNIAKQLGESFTAPQRTAKPPADVPVIGPDELDVLDPAFVANPYPHWEKLQQHKLAYIRGHEAVWVFDRSLVKDVFGRPADFVQQPSGNMPRGILTADGNQHGRLRRAFEEAFKTVMPNIPAWVDTACVQARDELNGRHEFDFVESFGRRVPRQVFWEAFVGSRLDDRERRAADTFAETQVLVFNQPEPRAGGDQAAAVNAGLRLAVLLAKPLAQAVLASTSPVFRPASIVDTLAAKVELLIPLPARTLGFVEVLMSMVQTVLAGMASHFLLGSAVHKLLQPDPRDNRLSVRPWDALVNKADPKALALALDEARRFDPPVTIVPRYAARVGVTLGTFHFPKDTPVFVVVGAANREGPTAHQPDQFHFDRPAGQIESLSFGHGVHECVGMALQQAIVPRALSFALNQWPALRLARPDAVPPWVDNVFFRSLQALSVTLCPATVGEPLVAPEHERPQG